MFARDHQTFYQGVVAGDDFDASDDYVMMEMSVYGN